MKRAYLTNGTLVQTAYPEDWVLCVDSTTYTYLYALLATDYCYLLLGEEEVVKIIGFASPNKLVVSRDVEGTSRRLHVIGDSLRYKLTEAELHDVTSYIGYSLGALGGISVTSEVVAYGPVAIEGLGGVQVDGDIVFYLRDVQSNVCCSVNTIPAIPPNYQKFRLVDVDAYRILGDGNYRAYQ